MPVNGRFPDKMEEAWVPLDAAQRWQSEWMRWFGSERGAGRHACPPCLAPPAPCCLVAYQAPGGGH
jgi:hypothetical protein